MSSLGYAITFLLCAPDGIDCETIALRAQRFDVAEQCQSAVPEAMRGIGRTRFDGARLKATCRSLADLCQAQVVHAPAYNTRVLRASWHRGLPGDVMPAQTAPGASVRPISGGQASPAVAAALAILCERPIEPGCGG